SILNGGAGNDEINVYFFAEEMTLNGGAGDDYLLSHHTVSCVLNGGAGNDLIEVQGRPGTSGQRAYGGPGDDTIVLSSENDGQAFGGAGNDRIELRSTAICTADGGAGDDFLFVDGN